MTDDNDSTAADDEQAGSAAAGDGDATADAGQRVFRIRKLYLKDVSFESPAAPGIFSGDSKAQPRISLQLNTENQQVGEHLYEVVLITTVTAADDDATAYLVEVRQAGLFEIDGFADIDHAHAIGSYCPSILFPYAREVVASLVQKGGFPQLALQPINFDAVFAQQLEKYKQDQAAQREEGQ